MPSNLLAHFNLTALIELCDVKTKEEYFELCLEEKNEILLDVNTSLYESKDLSEITIQDFPIRGKAVYLKIKRRRWRLKSDPNKIIRNDLTFIAEGSGFTKELSDFLKESGRYKG